MNQSKETQSRKLRRTTPKRTTPRSFREKRTHRVSTHLNDHELELLQHYIKRFKITNQSEFVRTLVLREIFRGLNKYYPSIFPEEEV